MSEAVWVSLAPRRDLGFGFTFIPLSMRDEMSDVYSKLEDATRKHLSGHVVEHSYIPDRLYWDDPADIPKTIPDIFGAGFLCFSEEVTSILMAQGVDAADFKPVELFDRDMKTPLGKTYSVFLPRGQLKTIDIQRSQATELWPGSELVDLAATLRPGENVFVEENLDVTDAAWTDPRVWRLIFLKNAVAEALVAAGFGKELYLKCLKAPSNRSN